MEQLLVEYSIFLLKTITIIGAMIAILSALKTKKHEHTGDIDITNLTEKYLEQQEQLEAEVFSDKEFKKIQKQKQQQKKELNESKKRVFVIDYNGDINADEVDALSQEITAILMIAKKGDEVLLKLESPGGIVNGYGLAASQLQRLKDHNIPLTIAVDKIAASGGYMMACVANQIIAAPFSIIGSIGVVAEVPNIHRLLKKYDIDVDVMTAGQYKRTVTFLGENTQEGKQKFEEELQMTHELFKAFVTKNRPQLNINEVATGEVWYGTQALELKLIDQLSTSEDFLLAAIRDKQVYMIDYQKHQSLMNKIGAQFELSIQNIMKQVLNKSSKIM